MLEHLEINKPREKCYKREIKKLTAENYIIKHNLENNNIYQITNYKPYLIANNSVITNLIYQTSKIITTIKNNKPNIAKLNKNKIYIMDRFFKILGYLNVIYISSASFLSKR